MYSGLSITGASLGTTPMYSGLSIIGALDGTAVIETYVTTGSLSWKSASPSLSPLTPPSKSTGSATSGMPFTGPVNSLFECISGEPFIYGIFRNSSSGWDIQIDSSDLLISTAIPWL